VRVTAVLNIPAAASIEERRPSRRLSRSYWRLWTASAVSNLGDGLALVAFPVTAALLTRNALLVAGVTIVQRLPWLLFALPAGALADRLNRAAAMAMVDVTRGLVLCAVAAAAHADLLAIEHLYLAAFALGALETVFAGAALAAVPALVDDHQLDRANGLLYATETTGAELIGPALGGAAVALAVAAPFALDGATFLLSAALLVTLRRRTPAPPRAARTQIRDDIREGVRFFRSHSLLRLVATLVGGLALFQSMVMAILVLFVTGDLGLSARGYGLFLAAGAVGSVLGGVVASAVRQRFGTAATLTAAAAVAAVGYLGIGLAPNAPVAAIIFAIEALAVSCGNVATMSLRQSLVPDHLRGRVGNVFRLCIWAGIPVGALLGGAVAAVAGIRPAIVAAGALQLVLAAVSAGRLRSEVIDLRLEPAPAVAA
jgi:MFS family permease